VTTGAVVEGLVYDAMEVLAGCTSLFGVAYQIEAVQARARKQRIRLNDSSLYRRLTCPTILIPKAW